MLRFRGINSILSSSFYFNLKFATYKVKAKGSYLLSSNTKTALDTRQVIGTDLIAINKKYKYPIVKPSKV